MDLMIIKAAKVIMNVVFEIHDCNFTNSGKISVYNFKQLPFKEKMPLTSLEKRHFFCV